LKKELYLPKISFINHTSYILEHKSINFMVDPWLEGKVFDDSWDLISKTKFQYEDF
jgi:hypothetical protein